MRERQREATLAFLRDRVIEIRSLRPGYLTVSWDQGGHVHSITSRYEDSPDDLIVQIPAIKRRWEALEDQDRKDEPAYDRT